MDRNIRRRLIGLSLAAFTTAIVVLWVRPPGAPNQGEIGRERHLPEDPQSITVSPDTRESNRSAEHPDGIPTRASVHRSESLNRGASEAERFTDATPLVQFPSLPPSTSAAPREDFPRKLSEEFEMFIQAKHLPNLFEESLRSHRDALAQSTRWKTAFTLPISKRTVDFVVFFERMDGESGAPKNFCWESSVDATIDGATEQVAFASGCIEHLGKSGGDAIAIALQVFHPQIAREWSAFLVPVPVLPRSTSLVVKALEVEGQKWRESEAAAWMAASPSRVSKPK